MRPMMPVMVGEAREGEVETAQTHTAETEEKEAGGLGTPMLVLQLLIGTRQGVRVEYVRASLLLLEKTKAVSPSPPPPPPTLGAGRGGVAGWLDDSGAAVLQHSNGFEANGIRVVAWGADGCRASEVSAVRFRMPPRKAEREYDACSGSGQDDAANGGAHSKEGKRMRRRRRWRTSVLSLLSSSGSARPFSCQVHLNRRTGANDNGEDPDDNNAMNADDDDGAGHASENAMVKRSTPKRRRRAAASALLQKRRKEGGSDEAEYEDDNHSHHGHCRQEKEQHSVLIRASSSSTVSLAQQAGLLQSQGWLELEMTDCDPSDVAYVWVILHAQRGEKKGRCGMAALLSVWGCEQEEVSQGRSSGSGGHYCHHHHQQQQQQQEGAVMRALPHTAHSFRIENTCGACRTPCELDLSAFRCLRRSKGTTGDLITMLCGTFAPCANRIQVDFRGVRSIAAMRQDWELISSMRAQDTQVSIYMLVMKACLGVPALIVDHGALPPGLNGQSASLAAEGSRRCYLSERMAAFCVNYTQHIDVCQAIELVDIKWDALLGDEVAEPLLNVRSSVHVSRRGGAMLRLIFPRGTAWDEAREAAVVCNCNRLLQVLRRALMGQPLLS